MKFDRNLHLIERGRTGANVGGGGKGHYILCDQKYSRDSLKTTLYMIVSL